MILAVPSVPFLNEKTDLHRYMFQMKKQSIVIIILIFKVYKKRILDFRLLLYSSAQ